MEATQTVASQMKGYKTTICIGGEDEKSKNIHGLQSLLMGDYEADLPKVNSKDTALLPYSSGTTGLPKGVQLNHTNLVANLEQTQHPAISDILSKYFLMFQNPLTVSTTIFC